MSYVSQVLADGAVGFWELAEPSGATATDQAGNSNGTYVGAITLGVPGIAGGGGATAAQNTTSSINNKVTIPSVAANQTVDTFTLEIWVKRTATQGATQRIMGANISGGAQLGFNASNQIQVGKIGVANIVASTAAITDTASFHHLVWTKSGATSKLYIDGADVTGAPTNATIVSNTGGWTLMEDSSNNNAPPAGVTFAMAAVYSTALSAVQVANHYSLGSSAPSAASTDVLMPLGPIVRGRFA